MLKTTIPFFDVFDDCICERQQLVRLFRQISAVVVGDFLPPSEHLTIITVVLGIKDALEHGVVFGSIQVINALHVAVKRR